jgi:hypothetical protein
VVSDCFNAPIHVIAELVDPEPDDLPAGVAQNAVPVKIIHKSAAFAIPVPSFAIDLDSELLVSSEQRKIHMVATDQEL